MKIAKGQDQPQKRSRVKSLSLIGVTIGILALTGTMYISQKPEFPQYKITESNNGVNSIIFKSHYLSILKGASHQSQFSTLLTRMAHFAKARNGEFTPNERAWVAQTLSFLDAYAHRNVRFWPSVAAVFDLKDGKSLFEEEGTGASAQGSQMEFWNDAKKVVPAHKGAAVHFFLSNKPGIMAMSEKTSAQEKFMIEFEKARLSLKLTPEDNLLCRVVENRVRASHAGFWGWATSFMSSEENKDADKQSSFWVALIARIRGAPKSDDGKTTDNGTTTQSPESSTETTPPAPATNDAPAEPTSSDAAPAEPTAQTTTTATADAHRFATSFNSKVLSYNMDNLGCSSFRKCSDAWRNLGNSVWKAPAVARRSRRSLNKHYAEEPAPSPEEPASPASSSEEQVDESDHGNLPFFQKLKAYLQGNKLPAYQATLEKYGFTEYRNRGDRAEEQEEEEEAEIMDEMLNGFDEIMRR